MPISPTYPGVYVQEIPSGVRTITGVSTSVTAFIGKAKRGPVDRAIEVLSFSDYERSFGGLDEGSEMSYAVRQFFLNGGSDAWVVRVAKNPQAASLSLKAADGATVVLNLTARNEGKDGNLIGVLVDYGTATPASTFSLTISYSDPNNPANNAVETYLNLSMNSNDPRYVIDMVEGISQLVHMNRPAGLTFNQKGASLSGPLLQTDGATLLDVQTLVSATANRFQVVVNGGAPVLITIDPAADLTGADSAARLESLRKAIQAKVQASSGGDQGLQNFACNTVGSNQLQLVSGTSGEGSSVRVLPGPGRDLSAKLFLGSANGGEETDAAAALRPAELLASGGLLSGAFGPADLVGLPSAAKNSLQIQLDGGDTVTIGLGTTALPAATPRARLSDVAQRIQSAVSAAKPASPAFRNFTATVDATGTKLILTSGSQGPTSAVAVTAAAANSIAAELHLLAGTTVRSPKTDAASLLSGGNDEDYTPDEAVSVILQSRAARKGLYALESVDLFNILCLPGVVSSAVLAEAAGYCEERRAFLVVDAPPPSAAKAPPDMVNVAAGTTLPKSDHAAVYYPWVTIGDPLRNGKPRLCAPCGTVAGLYARTDGTRGVWKAPAGTEANMLGVQSADYVLTDGENGTLNPHGVNCLRIFPVYGPVVWGARTLRGDDQMTSEYKYIPVRRLALYLEESLYRGLKWVVFEPNDEPLWAQIRLNVGAFLHVLFRQGAFQGKSPREAYFVKCDSETTTQNDINLGVVNVLVGFAPLKPAEFVILSIQQMAGQIET
jgi:phage tail sheath protein FI